MVASKKIILGSWASFPKSARHSSSSAPSTTFRICHASTSKNTLQSYSGLNPGILGVFSEVGFKSFGSANSLKYKKLDPLVVKEKENNTNINEVIQKMNDYVTYNSLGGWL